MSKEKLTENDNEQDMKIQDNRIILKEAIEKVFDGFSHDLLAAALAIEAFRENDYEKIDLLKNIITEGSLDNPTLSQKIIESLMTIAELSAKDESLKEIVNEKIKTFVEFQATRDHYNEQSSSKDSPNSFVDRYANRDAENNQGQSTSWCSML